MRISMRDLRLRAADVLAAVERGDPIELTFYRRPRARLVALGGETAAPPPGRAIDAQANPAFGMWRDRPEADVGPRR